MMVIWTLALNTFREAVRDRVLHSIFFFAVVTVCASLLLKDVTLGDQDKIVRSIAEGFSKGIEGKRPNHHHANTPVSPLVLPTFCS